MSSFADRGYADWGRRLQAGDAEPLASECPASAELRLARPCSDFMLSEIYLQRCRTAMPTVIALREAIPDAHDFSSYICNGEYTSRQRLH